MKRTVLIMMLVALSMLLNAQENYQPGSITNEDGECVEGYIDYREWDRNPKKINFKKGLEEKKSVYCPTEILRFTVGTDMYVGAVVFVENTSRKLNDLNHKKEFVFDQDTVFLQVIIEGEKSLYFYNKVNGVNNFYIKNKGEFELLLYKEYISHDKNLKKGVVENAPYRNQLMMYLMDCQEVYNSLATVNYELNSLKSLFFKYYKCSEAVPSYNQEKEKEKGSWRFGVVGGCGITFPSFDDGVFAENFKGAFENDKSFLVGASFEYIFPRSQGKWSLYNELLYTSYDFTSTFEFIQNADCKVITCNRLSYSYLNVINTVRFTYPVSSDFKVFSNLGICNGFALSEVNEKKREKMLLGVESEETEMLTVNSLNYTQGLLIGGGVKYGDFSLEARYSYNLAIMKVKNNSTAPEVHSSFNLILAYTF